MHAPYKIRPLSNRHKNDYSKNNSPNTGNDCSGCSSSAFATILTDRDGGIAVLTTTVQNATNSDDDTNNQANVFASEVRSEQELKQNSGTQNSAFVLNAATGGNTATQTSSQSVSASQSNTVNDDDVQTNNQCASGPTVISAIACANLGAGAELPDIDLGELLGGGLGGGM